MSWSREEILVATDGEMIRQGSVGVFREIVTDSNRVSNGSVFIALRGVKFDGHQFLSEAVRRGAACLVVHQKAAMPRPRNATVIRVRDTLQALGELALYRRLAVAPKVLAITGSNGKTTSKEMVAAILERATLRGNSLRGKVLKAQGNYNNLVGLPLTLLRLRGQEEVAVLEMGTSSPGEIQRLCRIARPNMGLITTVAPAHLSGLRTLAGVASEKGELFRELEPGGIAVVNIDDPWVRRLGARFKGTKVTYGREGEVRAQGWRFLGAKGTRFTLRVGGKRHSVRLRLCGEHNLSNALGAAAMAYGFGADLEAIRRGLEAVRPLPMRMAVERWRGVGIINDAYNANPSSMEAALKTLGEIGARGKTVAILGDMLELGSEARKSHLELGAQAARYGIDHLYLFGEQSPRVQEGALRAGMGEKQVTIGKSHRRIARMLGRQVRSGDWLLLKGSRGMEMEKILAELKETGL